MNKKILSKATALSIAAISVLSTAAMTASADITLKTTSLATQEASGTLAYVEWYLYYTDKETTATFTGTPKQSISVSFVDSPVSTARTVATDYLNYDAYNTTVYDSDNSTGTYYAKNSIATTATTQLGKVASYQNKTYANTTAAAGLTAYGDVVYTEGGTDAYTDWQTAFKNYVNDYNKYWASKNKFDKDTEAYNVAITNNPAYTGKKPEATDTAYRWTDHAGYYKYADAVAPVEPTAIGDTVFTKRTYALESSLTSIKLTDAKISNKAVKSIDIADLTGEVTLKDDLSGQYIVATGSSTADPTTNAWYPTNASHRTPSTISYYGTNGYWYTSAAAANLYAGGYSTTKTSNYTSSIKDTELWFSATTGFYYSTAASAKAASETGVEYYQVAVATTVYSTKYGSYRAANGLYYPTIAAAQNASYNYNRTYTYSTKATTASARYFSPLTGLYYTTSAAASAASGSYSYIDIDNYSGGTSLNVYDDPYYYYFMNGGLGWGNSITKIDPDAPTIYGSSKKSGWDRILAYINTKSTGSTVSIDMNKSTTVPESILSAAKKKGITLNFVNENGSKVKVTSSNINSNYSINTAVTYNVKNISSSLIKKAKKVNSDVVSTAQIAIGSDSKAAVTVKLASKRAGCTVKAYRLTAKGSLVLVSTAKVSSTGAVTLSTNQSGTYLLVVMDK